MHSLPFTSQQPSHYNVCMGNTLKFTVLASIFAVAACGGKEPAPRPPEPAVAITTATPTVPDAQAPIETVDGGAVAAKAPEPKAATPLAIWEGMMTPEGVVYDAEADRYLVSNINGKPLDADNNGFISELSPDGKVTKLKFVEGSPKAPLNAPKGMAIVKGTLYVADIDTVRMFDAKTGKAKGEMVGKGASFFNDIAASPDGRIFISDSGWKQGASNFEPTGADAIWQIKAGKLSPYIKDTELAGPNGLYWTPSGLAVCSDRVLVINDAFVNRTAKTKEAPVKFLKVTKVPEADLDGFYADETSFVVSSWKGKAIYKGSFGGAVTPILEGLAAPADFAVDTKRKRIIVPRFMDNKVEAYDLK
jgi:sugar lactone lactonase YvrE/predicted small lipoprotein YifL